jgi:succinate dehydrogenase / fumarate reductase membrane anchor subunit
MKKHTTPKSKSGLHHYVAQRVTAIALIPLSAWFVIFTINLSRAQSVTELHRLLHSPCEITAAILFIAMFLYHGFLGLQVIVEDYIHCPILKRCILLGLLFVSVVSLVAGLIAVIQLYITLKIFSPFVPY